MKNIRRLVDAAKRHPQDRMNQRTGESMAFKLALPGLGTIGEIREFIAAVAQGIALQFFDGREGSQLLYAAQVALSALEREKKGVSRSGLRRSAKKV
jgi:hypothetical protein